jgi:hypothetical protein
MKIFWVRAILNYVGLNPMISVLIRRGKFGHGHTHRKPHTIIEEIGVMCL